MALVLVRTYIVAACVWLEEIPESMGQLVIHPCCGVEIGLGEALTQRQPQPQG